MVYLYNQATEELVGEINEDELQFMIDQMEEEFDQGSGLFDYKDGDRLFLTEWWFPPFNFAAKRGAR